ncbi:MAG: hypothetical protein Q9179_005180 [Wetmoreana sp. 5 TL-2023]
MEFLNPFTLAGFLSSFVAEAPSSEHPLVKRLGLADEPKAISRMETLYTDIKQYTAVIGTAFLFQSLPATPDRHPRTPAKKATAGPKSNSTIPSINSLVVAAINDVKIDELEQATGPNAAGLPTQLALVIGEIGGALNNIIAILGLIAALLDSILGGLSLALAGLVL